MSSSAGVAGLPGSPAYSTTKAGVIMLSRVLAAEWGKYRVRVNSIAPGIIHTSFTRRPGQPDQFEDPTYVAETSALIPLGRIGEPEDVARVALFLASDLAGYVSGENIIVDGAWLQSLLPRGLARLNLATTT